MHVQITLVNYEYPGVTSNCGGGGAVTEALANGLRDRGHDVTVITDYQDGHYSTFPLRSYRRLAAHLREMDVDVINGHFSIPSSLAIARLATSDDVPFVVSVMGADVFDPTRFSLIRPAARQLNRLVFGAADRVVAPSSDMQSRVESAHPHSCDVIPYGTDVPDATASQPDRPRLLSVCRLVKRKNLQTAIEAVRELRSRSYDVEYRIVGTGPLEDEISTKADRHEWLTAPGYVKDVHAEYAAADVFYLPSRHEAFGMVFVEAMAHGLPVVTSDTGGQTDFVTPLRTGDLAPPNAPSAQADRLETVLHRRDELGDRAATVAREDYCTARMVDDYESLYQEVTA